MPAPRTHPARPAASRCSAGWRPSPAWAPLAGLASTWQTLLNSVTFGHNVALGAFGRARAAKASRPWQRNIDALATVVLAIPALIVALPIELAGGLTGRGAVLTLKLELL